MSHQSLAIDVTSHCVGHVTSASRKRPSSHHAYAPTPPSRCDSNTVPTAYASTSPLLNMLTLPRRPQKLPLTPLLPLLTPSPTRLILSAAYHPYARAVPSRNASHATLTPA
ncbi:hypothetical protein O181_069817 [Austropuccinia psidii MF-1]|uniref:Uncharacterized protein n=1 Tax=Austropuccinia psidii MF-1 TaxID=1389203 RepID=A0A9Q3F4U9_9BASI|nr:hypothetical protein [Austropuccinia psidii MF-1]